MAITVKPIPAPVQQHADVPTEPIYRLSVAQYHAMARAGILTEDDPVELLEGWLVLKMTKNRPHVVAVDLAGRRLERHIPSGWYVALQEPFTTAESEPEPDIAVIRGELQDYPDEHPRAEDVALIVEVADTSLRRDRGTKKRLYARAGIPVYWIVNLKGRRVEVYTEPCTAGKRADYRQRRDYGPEDEVALILTGVEVSRIAVRELFP